MSIHFKLVGFRVSVLYCPVDVSEIRRSPVDMVIDIPLFTRVLYIPGGFLAGFLNHLEYQQYIYLHLR